jgi:DNA-binding transcriptional MerR regulator
MFRIGEFSQIAQVSVRMLRHYDALGLLKPAHVDPHTDYRLYRPEQLARLHRIVALQGCGLTLKEIGALLHDGSDGALRAVLTGKQREVEQQIRQEIERAQRIRLRLKMLSDAEAGTLPETVIKVLPPLRVACTQAVAADLEQVGPVRRRLNMALYATLRARGLRPTGREVVVYEVDEYRDVDIPVRYALPVDAPLEPPRRLPEGEIDFSIVELAAWESCACTAWTGRSPEIVAAIAGLYRWAAEHGYEPAAGLREVHLSHEETRLSRERDETYELQLPLRPRPAVEL